MQNPIKSSSDVFLRTILRLGPSNILFLAPLRPQRRFLFMKYSLPGDPVFAVPARIVQDKHRLYNGSIIELESTIPGFARRTFGVQELAERIARDRILSPDSRSYAMFAELDV